MDEWCWNLTPWTCDHEYPYSVRYVSSSGALRNDNAYSGDYGVRPLCYLKSEISVSILGEDDEEEQDARREEMKLEAVDAIMSALNDYPTYLWGDALGTAVAALFQSKQDVEEMEENDNG